VPEADFYADPFIYDVLHAPGTSDDVSALLRIVRRHLKVTSQLTFLEPACGSGRYLIALSRKGYSCTGFDLLAPMVQYAAARAKELQSPAEFFVADMRTFTHGRKLKPMGVVFNLINSIRHLPGDAALVEHLREVTRVLAPDGVYIVGISLCVYGIEDPCEDVWEGARDGTRVVQAVQYFPAPGPQDRDERVVSHLTITDSLGRERHVDSNYVLYSYTRDELEATVAAAGLRVKEWVSSDGRESLDPRGPGYVVAVLELSTT